MNIRERFRSDSARLPEAEGDTGTKKFFCSSKKASKEILNQQYLS